MTGSALAIVLAAALLHALWNALVKAADDRALVIACVAAAHTVVGGTMIALAGVPNPASWGFIAASAFLHYFYYWLLLLAYRVGDLSLVYPVARGSAPLLVALGARFFAGEILPWPAWIGIWIVSAGIGMLSFASGAAHLANPKPLLVALATGIIIAGYSVVDGMGVRLSGDPFAYMGWLFMSEAVVVIVVARRRWGRLATLARPAATYAVLGGLSSVAAYSLVIYANTIAVLGAVSAVRELSVVIAALIGVFALGERPWGVRIAASSSVGAGVIILATSGAVRS